MALSRATLATELGTRAGGYLRAVGLTTADTTGNLKESLDDTLRAMGTTYTGLATATLADTSLDQFIAVGTVYVLRAAIAEATRLADVAATTLGASKRQSQIVENLERALARAESQAAVYGIAVLSSTMTTGVMTFDLIEPEAVA